MDVPTKNLRIAGELARRCVVHADEARHRAEGQLTQTLEDYPGRSTLLCRLGPGRRLPADTERRGLEILVVEGEIEVDDRVLGQYGYMRHPGGPSPLVTAISRSMLFVKRGHIPPEDTAPTVTVPQVAMWQVDPASGLPTLPLHRQGDIAVVLRRYQAGTAPVTHRPPKGEETLVLEGTLLDERSAYARGSWIRHPPGSLYQPYSLEGCLVYAQSGHLPIV